MIEPSAYQKQAEGCRRLAVQTDDEELREALAALAQRYDQLHILGDAAPLHLRDL